MDFIAFLAAAFAIWRLHRIRYWSAYPLFYAKLLLATICYLMPNPSSEAWWRNWWATLDPAILCLMLLAGIEASGKLFQRIEAPMRLFIGVVAFIAAFCAFSSTLLLIPPKASDWLDFYIWFSRAAHVSIVAAMLGPAFYDLLIPVAATVASVHFLLLTIVNLAVAVSDLAFPWITIRSQWDIVHYAFQTVYAAMLISWATLIPRAISLPPVSSSAGAMR